MIFLIFWMEFFPSHSMEEIEVGRSETRMRLPESVLQNMFYKAVERSVTFTGGMVTFMFLNKTLWALQIRLS